MISAGASIVHHHLRLFVQFNAFIVVVGSTRRIESDLQTVCSTILSS